MLVLQRSKGEFLHVDDMADAAAFVLGLPQTVYVSNTQPMLSHITLDQASIIPFWNWLSASRTSQTSKARSLPTRQKPDGTMRKLMNVDRLGNLGWRAKIALDDGIAQTYR